VDPTWFQLWTGTVKDSRVPPTVRRVSVDFVVPFASKWNRLYSFASFGPESVLLVEGTESTSAFDQCLRRCHPSRVLERHLRTGMVDGTVQREPVLLQDVLTVLARPFVGSGNEESVGFVFRMKQ